MAKKGGFPGMGMPGNMNNLMKQAQRMQRQMEEANKQLEESEFTATAGGGVVEAQFVRQKSEDRLLVGVYFFFGEQKYVFRFGRDRFGGFGTVFANAARQRERQPTAKQYRKNFPHISIRPAFSFGLDAKSYLSSLILLYRI